MIHIPTEITEFKGEYFFLSNFYEFPIEYKGKKFASTEVAYQWAKTDDPEYKRLLEECTSSSASKKLGKSCPLRDDWDDIKLSVMRELIYIKFVNTELTKQLKDTHDAELIEGNWWGDTYWGVCKGTGKNHLGKLLMEVRNFLYEHTSMKSIPQSLIDEKISKNGGIV